jgi:hypothetical protein
VFVPSNSMSEPPAALDVRNARFLVAGGALGLVLAFLIGPLVGLVFTEGQLGGGLLTGAAAVALVWPWVLRGQLQPRVLALGLIVLAIHLLAAGGISYAGVAYTFWLLAALAINASEPERAPDTPLPLVPGRLHVQSLALGLSLLASAAAAACYHYAARPVLLARAATTKAEEAERQGAQEFAVRVLWLDAVKADPWAPEPWSALAQLELATIRRNPADQSARQRFSDSVDELVRLRPRSSSVYRQVGQWLSEIDRLQRDDALAKLATDYLRRAVALYPTLAIVRAEYAQALVRTGHDSAAKREARTALELSAATPHADKKLPAAVHEQMQTLAATPAATPKTR